jgi:hypothetical protein
MLFACFVFVGGGRGARCESRRKGLFFVFSVFIFFVLVFFIFVCIVFVGGGRGAYCESRSRRSESGSRIL